MNIPVPTYHESKCQYMGMTERTKPIPENTVNAVLTAVILAEDRPERRVTTQSLNKYETRAGERVDNGPQGGGSILI
jgi:hypothetical protein